MTVGDLMLRMTVAEAHDWRKFFDTRPWPEDAADLQNAILCSIVANLVRGANTPAHKADDFRVLRRREPQPTTDQALSMADRFMMERR